MTKDEKAAAWDEQEQCKVEFKINDSTLIVWSNSAELLSLTETLRDTLTQYSPAYISKQLKKLKI